MFFRKANFLVLLRKRDVLEIRIKMYIFVDKKEKEKTGKRNKRLKI